jgi:transcription-repair coupling factor (superfamily II helicase)
MGLTLGRLIPLICELPAYQDMATRLQKGPAAKAKAQVLDAAKPYVIAALYDQFKMPVLVVTAQPEGSKKLFEQVSTWCDAEELRLFPEPDTLPYQRTVPDFGTEQDRLQVLFALVNQNNRSKPPIVVTSIPALMQKIILKTDFLASCSRIKTGVQIDPLSLLARLENIGYRSEPMVEFPGTVSRRGGIVDIFPPTSDEPVRLEFFGNTVESIRSFDSSSQRSTRKIDQIDICPATEIIPGRNESAPLKQLDLTGLSTNARDQIEQDLASLAGGRRPQNMPLYAPLFNRGTLLDYLPPPSLVVLDDLPGLQKEINHIDKEAVQLREEKLANRELPANFPRPYFTWEDLEPEIDAKKRVELSSWSTPDEQDTLQLGFTSPARYAGQLPSFIQKSGELMRSRNRVIIVSNQATRLSELFEESDILVQPTSEMKEASGPGSLTLLQGSLAEGWVMNNNTYLLTDSEIFGFTKERRFFKRRSTHRHKMLVDMIPGDFVVHVEHGIGKFSGVQNVTGDGTQREYLVLEYAAGDKLFVPTDQIDRVSRYIGSGEFTPSLSRLGSQEWNHAKQKVKADVEEIAQDLLQLYAAREVVPGHSFSPDTIWQRELEASFPYVETPDQIKVQEEIKEDMSRPKPMDRLLCGDVGYGKTEIAVRASFKAVMDNKQVAVLVPTTVLAEQHFNTFKERMGAFPVQIEVLSRFRNEKEQKAVIDGLADGSVDICIGTHRLLQKDVVFKDLGLLVIDEEQRFGVAHKEYLKKLREEVDVLTLSATPIPRTLHMSLVGVRDMSIMETPPEERLPIKTYVAEYDERLVREAILREIDRNGQVFFVHNRVLGISSVAARLASTVPEARISVAHGQMPEDALEGVMAAFQRGDSNVMVCTTIIESGLDMPRANTLIVNRADKFGLTQLYQLRGRVGRGGNLAYAYFLYDKGRRLSSIAEKRLRTIYEAAELGAGFGIAMKDLEIRGAGTLLGTKQSGSITSVGFNLYCELLSQAVEENKAKLAGPKSTPKAAALPETTIDLPLKAFIPDDYISDLDSRLSIYQRLTEVKSLEGTSELSRELADRFGTLPPEVENLLYILRIKAMAAQAGIESISTADSVITLRRFPGLQFERPKLAPMLKYGINIGITQVIMNSKRLGRDWQKALEEILSRSARQA